MQADIAPDDCSLFRRILDGKCASGISCTRSGVIVEPYQSSLQKCAGESDENVGLTSSPGVLWMNELTAGSVSITIADEGPDDGWTSPENCGRIVNWAELESLIEGPFARFSVYEIEGYSERFSAEGTEDEEIPE